MATQELETMTFNAVKQNHKKLANNSKISDDNKQVLNEFFRKMGSKGTGQTALKDYASRFNTLSRVIDFKLDQAEKEDIESIVNALNTDELRKENGEPYSDYSKDDIWKAFRVFYNKFIKKGRVFKKELDGQELVDDLDVNVDLSTDIEIHTQPTPEHVQKVAEHTIGLILCLQKRLFESNKSVLEGKDRDGLEERPRELGPENCRSDWSRLYCTGTNRHFRGI